MRITEKELDQYINQIKNLLVCKGKERQRFLNDFDDSISEFLKNDPDADMNALQKAMGTPHEIADEFLANGSSKDIKKRMSVVRIAMITGVSVLIIAAIFLIAVRIDVHIGKKGYYEVTEYRTVDETMPYIENATEQNDNT